MLALHRPEQQAAANPAVQFILAIEEPEAFLHPQRQKELYQAVREAQSENLRLIVTSHSPYVVAETPFMKLALVRKDGQYSTLHTAQAKDAKEEAMFDAYSNDVNALLFFAEKVVFVEGESDVRALKVIFEKHLGPKAHRISIISAAGNKNFSPFLRMIKAWQDAKIPHLVVTDFDSLTKESDRAIIVGVKDAGYSIPGEAGMYTTVDDALDKDEEAFTNAAVAASAQFAQAGLNVFIFTSDLEFSLVSPKNKDAVAKVLTSVATNGKDYTNGYDLVSLRRQLGSKGVPLNPMEKPPFKKPFVHKIVAETIDLNDPHPDILRLLAAVTALDIK